jgi:tetratricopeptide (TPR) repeat protein
MFLNGKGHQRREYILFAFSCICVAAAYLIFAFSYLTTVYKPGLIAPIPILHASFSVRLLTLPKIIFYYLYAFVYPEALGVSQQWLVTRITVNDFIFPLFADIIFLTGVLLAGIYIQNKNRKLFVPFLFFALWFLLGSVQTWQIFPLDMTVADRWFYFPMVGLLGMLGILISPFSFYISRFKFIFISLALLLLCGYSYRTVIRNADWHDSITLFTHDSTVSYQSYDLFNQLGYDYLLLGDSDAAKPYLDRSIQLAPEYWETWANLGVYYESKNEINKSARMFLKSIKYNPDYYLAYMNLTRLYYYHNSLAEGNTFLATEALVKFPADPYLWSVKGVIDYRTGKKQLGITEVQKAYALSSDNSYLSIVSLMQNNDNLSTLH